jgi:predicted DNA-binding ribbon-helix-helix protein
VSEERHTTCVQLPEATWQALKEIADRKGVTVSDVIRDAIDTKIFIDKVTPPKTDIDALERMIIVAFEMVKASYGDRK